MALNGKPRKPWIQNIYDLSSLSLRINLEYKPMHKLQWKDPAPPAEAWKRVTDEETKAVTQRPTEDNTEDRCRKAVRAILDEMPDDSVTFIVSHACPVAYFVKELNPAPGGCHIPDYKAIKSQVM